MTAEGGSIARDVAIGVLGMLAGALILTALVTVPAFLLFAVLGPWGAIGWCCFLGLLCLGGGRY